MTELEMMTQGERVLWKGKPNLKCFIFEAIFNKMLLIALLWGGIDFFFISAAMNADNMGAGTGKFLIVFFALHLMPVWLYLGGVITAALRYKNTQYIITERGIYVSSGIITKSNQMKPFTEISNFTVHRGVFDRILGVGDVICSYNIQLATAYAMGGTSSRSNMPNTGLCICDIADYQEVFNMLKTVQTDVYSDTMYPNAMRPENNPGYNTSYDKFQ